MKILIISVGKRHDAAFNDAIQQYEQRLQPTASIEWRLIAPSSLHEQMARSTESRKIMATLKPSDMVWLLDERGEEVTSPALSNKLVVLKTHAISRLVIIIGGAFGVDESVRTRANWMWSLSPLVFPHQIVRLLLIEQLYRASQIEKGTGYHHV